jgi:DNA helicase IV
VLSVDVVGGDIVIVADHSNTIPYARISKIELTHGVIWLGVRVHMKNGQVVRVRGLPKGSGYSLFRKILEARWLDVQETVDEVEYLTGGTVYASNHAVGAAIEKIDKLSFALNYPSHLLKESERNSIEKLFLFKSDFQSIRRSLNQAFVPRKIAQFVEFFDSIESFPLTTQQRVAVVTNEDNNLVIAGAGSGKTSVIAARACYLLRERLCQPDNMLLLAFSHDAKNELETRIQDRLDEKVEAKTFHSIGLRILSEVEGRKPSLSDLAADQRKMLAYIRSAIKNAISDKTFASLFITFFQSHFAPYHNALEFESYEDYNQYILVQEIRSLNGDIVKSYEECEIANFLYLNGISFEYEKKYEIDTATEMHRQYQPDFFLNDHGIYIEHFGVDKDGNAPKFMNPERYREGMEWKREIHEKNETILIETFSFEKSEGLLLSNLRKKLEEHEIEFNPISDDDVFDKLQDLGQVDRFSGLVGTFLNQFKSNQLKIGNVREQTKSLPDKARNVAFLDVFEVLYETYENDLKEAQNIDFSDMIAKATEYVENGRYRSKYKHILVDEFQDISIGRANLLRALLRQSSSNILFCVGDDWQAIFRFGGSDISIMRKFENWFGCTATTYLDKTFRFNNMILDVSSKFVLQNPAQISKEMNPHREEDKPRVVVARSKHKDEDVLGKILGKLSRRTEGEKLTILLLGRYNFLKPANFHELSTQFPNFEMSFMSVHKSKGLEADYVIVLDMSSRKYGFPSQITDDPIINLVLAEAEPHANAEERRLFYVAMTRAREGVFLITDRINPSTFVTEIEDGEYEIGHFGFRYYGKCLHPNCNNGRLVKRQNRETQEYFLGCSNFPDCRYSRPLE